MENYIEAENLYSLSYILHWSFIWNLCDVVTPRIRMITGNLLLVNIKLSQMK